MEDIYQALCHLRVPLQINEYDLHSLVMQTLTQYQIPYEHEVKLVAHSRIDIMCGSVGIEIKRGKPDRSKLIKQLQRYANCPQVSELIVIVERSVDLPSTILGKNVRTISLNRLWGIAL